MPKFYGTIGFMETKETTPGVWTEEIVERQYYGDITRTSSSMFNQSQLNDNIKISNSFSIVADPYAYEHFSHMRYIVWQGVKWKIESVDAANPPRLTFTVSSRYIAPSDEET